MIFFLYIRDIWRLVKKTILLITTSGVNGVVCIIQGRNVLQAGLIVPKRQQDHGSPSAAGVRKVHKHERAVFSGQPVTKCSEEVSDLPENIQRVNEWPGNGIAEVADQRIDLLEGDTIEIARTSIVQGQEGSAILVETY